MAWPAKPIRGTNGHLTPVFFPILMRNFMVIRETVWGIMPAYLPLVGGQADRDAAARAQVRYYPIREPVERIARESRSAPHVSPSIVIEGRAIPFETWSTGVQPPLSADDDARHHWERYMPGCFTVKPSCFVCIRHDGPPIASVLDGTLAVEEDDLGLSFRAVLDAEVLEEIPELRGGLAVSILCYHRRVTRNWDGYRAGHTVPWVKSVVAADLEHIALLPTDHQPAFQGTFARVVDAG